MDKNNYNLIQNLLIIFLSLFGLFIAYQILLKILGGSWETEDIILAMIIFNVGLTFTIGFNQAKLKSDHNHLSNQFYCLAKDFKEHVVKGEDN